MGLSLVTGPSTYPVTADEAKLHCRIDGTDENTLVDDLIAAATDYVEQYTGRAIVSQTWKVTQDAAIWTERCCPKRFRPVNVCESKK